MAASDPIRNKKQLKELAGYWLKKGNLRNYTLIVLGVCTALRVSDLLSLTWDDVYNEKQGAFRTHIVTTEKKTGKQRTLALNEQAIKALHQLLPHKRSDYIFASNRKQEKAISRVHAWRIVKESAEAIQTTDRVSVHSLRSASVIMHGTKASTRRS